MKKSSKLEQLRKDTPESVREAVDAMVEALDRAYNQGYVKGQMDAWRVSIEDRSRLITVLEAFAGFLEDRGYTDTDWRAEEPYAIDEFLKEYKYDNLSQKENESQKG